MNKLESMKAEEQENLDRISERLEREKAEITRDLGNYSSQGMIDPESYPGSLVGKLSRLEDASNQLYYAHLKLEAFDHLDGERQQEELFIGKHSYSRGADTIIHSWAAPVCWHYLQYQPSIDYSFDYDGYQTDYHLHTRRDVTILAKKVQEVQEIYSDEQMEGGKSEMELVEDGEKLLYDKFLQDLQRRRGQSGPSDIIFTIQKEQAAIINAPLTQNLLVQGCAGSGKSMIMLHRLPILLYDERNQKQRTGIVIISPSEVYTNEIHSLVRELEIEDIPSFVLSGYYREKIIRSPLVQEGGRLFQNWKDDPIRRETVDFVYSEEMLDLIEKNVNELVREIPELSEAAHGVTADIETRGELSEIRGNRIQELEGKKLAPNELSRIKWNYEFQILEKLHPILKREAGASLRIIHDVQTFLGNLRHLSARVAGQKREQQKRTEFLALTSALNNLVSSYRMPDRAEDDPRLRMVLESEQASRSALEGDIINRTAEENIRRLIEIVESEQAWSVRVDLKQLHRDYERLKTDLGYGRTFAFEKEDYKGVLQMCEGLNDDTASVQFILRRIMEIIVERDPAIKEERSYSFSPYLAAWIMLYYYKRPNGKFLPLASDRLVLIDEAQNLMPLEITLICKINSRVTLNLFGDVNQHVPSEKGVNSWPEKLLQSMKTQKFNLNQNYRNAESITRFCNEELDLDMIPISLEGDPIHVEEISSWKMLPKALESRIRQRKKGYRFAILYKGVKMPDALAAISGKFGANELDEENADISREKINIAHVRVVKGIEFDEAVVIDSGDLLREELYIAYTRALARLSVIRIRNSGAKRSKTEV